MPQHRPCRSVLQQDAVVGKATLSLRSDYVVGSGVLHRPILRVRSLWWNTGTRWEETSTAAGGR